jgi:hypothetical protein
VPWPVGANGQAAVEIVLGIKHPSGGLRALETVSLVTSAYDMEGRFKGGSRGRAQVQMSAATTEAAEYEVYSRLPLPPGRYQLRLSVDHRARSETGSVYTDIDVPDFRRPGLHLAGLLLDAGPTRLKAAPPDTFVDDLPVFPTAQREFRLGARFLVFARLLQGGKEALGTVTVTSRLTDEAGRAVRTTTNAIAAAQFSKGRAADYRIGLTTEGLTPGWYLVDLEAALPNSLPERKTVALRVVQ